MSNNAHELSNRLLNALDNNYNVSFRVLMIVSPINLTRYETVHEPMTPDSMLRFGISRGCLGSALCCAKFTRCVDNRPNNKSEYSADRGAETDRVDT